MSRRLLAVGLVVLSFVGTLAVAFVLWPDRESGANESETTASAATVATENSQAPPGSLESDAGIGGDDEIDALGSVGAEQVPGTGPFAMQAATEPFSVSPRLKHPPSAGLLFDVETGEVLWARKPAAERPIASLTKMMTALIIAEDHSQRESVRISPKAPGVEGSRIGVLRAGREVPLRGLFLGLIMVSGNDAAVALAEHDAGSVARVREADEPARFGVGAELLALRRPGRPSGHWQQLLCLRPGLARPCGPRQPEDRRGHVVALGRAAVPDQGRDALALQQPLLRPVGDPGTAEGPGDRRQDRAHERSRPLLCHDRPPGRPAPRGGAAGLARPDPPGSAASARRVRRETSPARRSSSRRPCGRSSRLAARTDRSRRPPPCPPRRSCR